MRVGALSTGGSWQGWGGEVIRGKGKKIPSAFDVHGLYIMYPYT